jgi:hypothetical protein
MRCIRESCKYYREHDFYQSIAICSLVDISFKKNSNINCMIDDCLAEFKNEIIKLEKYKEYITKHN